MAYEQVAGPLGGERDDLLNAMLAAVIASSASGKSADPKKFMPPWHRQEQTWQEQLAIVQGLNRELGGEDRRGHDRVPDGEARS